MLSYNHFTLDERKYLQELLSRGYSMRKIAGFLGRSPSSVSREIQRNRTHKHPKNKPDNRYWYPLCQEQGGLSQKESKTEGDFSMKLEPKVHDNRSGLDYVVTDNYYLPALRLPEDKRPIG